MRARAGTGDRPCGPYLPIRRHNIMEYGGTGYGPNEPVCRKSRTVRIAVAVRDGIPYPIRFADMKICRQLYIVSNNVFKFNV